MYNSQDLPFQLHIMLVAVNGNTGLLSQDASTWLMVHYLQMEDSVNDSVKARSKKIEEFC